jgi:hypothetical protein
MWNAVKMPQCNNPRHVTARILIYLVSKFGTNSNANRFIQLQKRNAIFACKKYDEIQMTNSLYTIFVLIWGKCVSTLMLTLSPSSSANVGYGCHMAARFIFADIVHIYTLCSGSALNICTINIPFFFLCRKDSHYDLTCIHTLYIRCTLVRKMLVYHNPRLDKTLKMTPVIKAVRTPYMVYDIINTKCTT